MSLPAGGALIDGACLCIAGLLRKSLKQKAAGASTIRVYWRVVADRDAYDQVADKVGMVPNLRVRDNIIQAISAGVGLVLGVGIGALVTEHRGMGALIGAGAGLVAGGLISGAYLCVVGLLRKS